MKFAQLVFIGSTFAFFVSGSIDVYGQEKPIVSLIPETLVEDCFPPAPPDCGGTFVFLDLYEETLITGNFIIEVDGPHENLEVNLQTSGTATSGLDYQSLPETFILNSGDGRTFYWQEIYPFDDDEIESDETLMLTLIEGDGYTVSEYSDYQLTFTLIDNEEEQSEFNINAGLADPWFEPEVDGQGFVINVFPVSKTMLITWFTYELAPRIEQPDGNSVIGDDKQRWFSAQGSYDGNKAELAVQSLPEGKFGEKNTVRETVGSMTAVFSDCNNGQLTYKVGITSGVSKIERVAHDNIPLCEELDEKLRQGN